MRYIYFIILFIFLNQCTTSTPQTSTTSTPEISACKIKNNSSLEETDPKWFIEKEAT